MHKENTQNNPPPLGGGQGGGEVTPDKQRTLAGEEKKLPGIKQVISVGSGKGGVGKSTVAANLALALKADGAKVGFLDADLYGPSAPTMFGIPTEEKPKVVNGTNLVPIERFGLPIISIGFLVEPGDAIIWRGPMLDKMLRQFLENVQWGELDYLVVDLPPGTGDVQLSLSQHIPITGAVLVSTPQDVAMADVRRAAKMFRTMKVPLLGIVDNMATMLCTHCEKESPVFGETGGELSRYSALDIPLLASLPFERTTCTSGDAGTPIVAKDKNSAQAKRFLDLAKKVASSDAMKVSA